MHMLCFNLCLCQNGLTALHHAAMSGEALSCKVLVQELHMDPDTPAQVRKDGFSMVVLCRYQHMLQLQVCIDVMIVMN